MKRLAVRLLISTYVLVFCFYHPCGAAEHREIRLPKNIILFIGDGMGVAHITAAKVVHGTLNLERFKTMGLLTTNAHDEFVTDSAASGTALATGRKTNNGAVSVSPEGEPLKTVLEWAEEKGKSTGIVVTCSVTHATPAVFVSHVDQRQKEDQIAEAITAAGLEVLFGGGLSYFEPNSVKGSNRKDNKDLVKELEKHMKVSLSVETFRQENHCDRFAALLAAEALPEADKRNITLAEMTQKAVRILSQNKKGFFLMVEGSQIDWGGHANDKDDIITEMIDFDNAVGVGLDFAKTEPQTLVIVTADHETGGFALHDGSVPNRTVTRTGFTTTDHTAAMVPLFALGPGSDVFGGIHDNTFVGQTMIRYMRGPDKTGSIPLSKNSSSPKPGSKSTDRPF